MATSPSGRVGVMLPRDLPVNQILPFARRAEELGFDELWVVEDLGFRGGIAQAATVLAVTSRIAVGVGILPAAVRNVAFSAMELATLAQLHPGRLIAGIGHGMPSWMREAGVWPKSPLTLLREYSLALKALLRGQSAPANGRYVKAEGTVIGEVSETAPPIVLGVRGPKSLALVGEVSDGVVLAEPSSPAYIRTALATITDAVPSAAPLVIAYDFTVVAETTEEAHATVRPLLATTGEPDTLPHIVPLPFADELATLRADSADSAEFATRIPTGWITDLALAGTADQVRAGIRARHDAGATSVVLIPVGEDRLAALDQLATAL